MLTVSAMADSSNRIERDQLRDFIQRTSLVEFAAQAKHPFLVGKAFYESVIAGKSLKASSGSTWRIKARADGAPAQAFSEPEDDTNTAKLSKLPPGVPSAGDESLEASGWIYLVAKRLGGGYPENVIAIGRASDNDIVIPAPALSKRHAQIGVFKDMHFIVDVNSTNGTKVDAQNAAPGVKVQLQFNSVVSLGGVAFVFVSPISVYRAISSNG